MASGTIEYGLGAGDGYPMTPAAPSVCNFNLSQESSGGAITLSGLFPMAFTATG